MKEGEHYEIEGYLGVDPFFYFEELNQIENIPPLIYEWNLKKIDLEITPWIERMDESGGKIMERDRDKVNYREVLKTDAWGDDEGSASYLFEVELVGATPLRKR